MDYSGINAKIKAMIGTLLKNDEYEMLCNLKSVEELGLKLREFPEYKKEVDSIGSSELSRMPIEQKIILSLYDDYARIYSFIGNFNTRKFLDGYFLKNEIHIIKLLLCMVYDEREITYSTLELNDLIGKKFHIDVEKLKKSKNVPEFIENLNGTEFYHVLSSVHNEDTSLFKLEMQLDLYYYMHLWRLKNKYLDKTNSVLINHLVGSEIDMRNITWIYRLKKYYKVETNLIYTYLIPIHYRLKPTDLNRMAETKSTDEMLTEILASPYGKLLQGKSIEKGVDKLESIVYKEMGRLYRVAGIMHPNSLAVILSFIFFKELEIENIISLLEGVRYGLEPKEILTYLNLLKEEEAS